jgi:hypothetical protein
VSFISLPFHYKPVLFAERYLTCTTYSMSTAHL